MLRGGESEKLCAVEKETEIKNVGHGRRFIEGFVENSLFLYIRYVSIELHGNTRTIYKQIVFLIKNIINFG